MRRSNAPSLKRQLPDAETAKEPVADAAAPPAPKAPRVVPSRPLLHAVKPVVAAPSNLAATPADPAAVAKSLYFSVVWCKAAAANRKHVKWEGDAILMVSGGRATLKDMEGKDIGTTTSYGANTLATLGDGETIQVGGKHLEIMGKIAAEAYESGKCFLSNGGKRAGSAVSAPTAAKAPSRPMASVVKENVAPSATSTDSPRKSAPVGAGAGVMQPRHDPNSPNALVFTRPSAAYIRTHGQGRQVVDVVIDPKLGNVLRPHQREGVSFLYECVMGMRDFDGYGAILADEMGLGKTLQTVSLVWTLLKQGPFAKQPVVRRALVVCPATLVKNWQNEFKRWLGDERVRTFALDYDSSDIGQFINSSIYSVLIIGYEKFRTMSKQMKAAKIDLAIFDEGHKLKNANVKISQAIRDIPTHRRVILTGTPIQNDLSEFFAMVDVINPGILGNYAMFKKVFEDPIVAARQKECTPEETALGEGRSAELMRLTNMFILRRTNDINKKYLPAKTEVVVFCPPTEAQKRLYRDVINSQVFRMATGTAGSPTVHLFCLTLLRKLCNSLQLLKDERAGDDDDGDAPTPTKAGRPEQMAYKALRDDLAGKLEGVDSSEHSGKLMALRSLLKLVRGKTREKVVLVSSYTQTLDVFETMCGEDGYSFLRLDGATPTNKRQAIVDRFNSKHCDDFILLLSARAGGVGLNLVGASRIVLYDINWNPAIDLQAMARIWREGQARPVVIYRLLTTGSIEEKVYQRQLSKIALSDAVIDEKQGVKMAFTKEDLKDLFTFQDNVDCLTHDLMGCDCLGAVKGPVAAARRGRDEDLVASLNKLREWQHINATNYEGVHVEDQFLRDLVRDKLAGFVFHRHAPAPGAAAADTAEPLGADDDAMADVASGDVDDGHAATEIAAGPDAADENACENGAATTRPEKDASLPEMDASQPEADLREISD